jgi:hypothetical protein
MMKFVLEGEATSEIFPPLETDVMVYCTSIPGVKSKMPSQVTLPRVPPRYLGMAKKSRKEAIHKIG